MSPTGHPFPESVKAEAFRLRAEGLSQRQIAERLRVPRGTVCKWLVGVPANSNRPVFVRPASPELWVGDELRALVAGWRPPR